MAGNARLKMVADVIRGVFTGYDIYRYEQDEIVVFARILIKIIYGTCQDSKGKP